MIISVGFIIYEILSILLCNLKFNQKVFNFTKNRDSSKFTLFRNKKNHFWPMLELRFKYQMKKSFYLK